MGVAMRSLAVLKSRTQKLLPTGPFMLSCYVLGVAKSRFKAVLCWPGDSQTQNKCFAVCLEGEPCVKRQVRKDAVFHDPAVGSGTLRNL